jgi:hypothetical protein
MKKMHKKLYLIFNQNVTWLQQISFECSNDILCCLSESSQASETGLHTPTVLSQQARVFLQDPFSRDRRVLCLVTASESALSRHASESHSES